MTKQYEPCEHRHGSGLMGVDAPEYYDTPCEHCEADDWLTAWIVGIFLAVAVAVVWEWMA